MNKELSFKIPVSVLIAVKNEAPNLPKCLESLKIAKKILILDSNSTDRTASIAKKFKTKLLQFHYKGGYPKKRQWGLNNLKLKTPWILLIDADEEVPESLWQEIEAVTKNPLAHSAYIIKKQFHFLGRKFNFGGFSFGAVLLFQKGTADFEQLISESANALDMEVHERLIVKGTIGKLKTPLIHNDFKGLEAYLNRHNQYSSWEARLRKNYIESGQYGEKSISANIIGNTQERRRFLKKIIIRLPLEPYFWFFYHYILRLGFLEGKPGFIACKIRSHYIFQVRAKLYELQKAGNEKRY